MESVEMGKVILKEDIMHSEDHKEIHRRLALNEEQVDRLTKLVDQMAQQLKDMAG